MPNKKKDHPFKNHQMPMGMRLYFSALTGVFKVLGVVSPALAGRLALRLFMTPPKFRMPRKEQALRDAAEHQFIEVRGRKISLRFWGEAGNPIVLLSHGWGGRCTQFHAFIQPLVEAGYRVIGFDVPGHGDSGGKRSNMMDVASIIAIIEKKFGPLHAIIAHSFGTGTALLAQDKYHVKSNKLVLIAYLPDVIWVTELFGELFDLSASTLQAMRDVAQKKFADRYDIEWTWQDVSPLHTIQHTQAELLLIHDQDDHEVPYSQAQRLQAVAPQAQLINTQGLGHRKILMSKKVINSVLAFLKI